MAVRSLFINRDGMWGVIAIVLSFVTACTESKGSGKKVIVRMPRQIISSSIINSMQEGDLALRRGRDVASYMISQTGVKDRTYSHCGLVHIERGEVYVYHFINGVNRQGLVKDKAKEFFSSVENSAVAVKRYELSIEERKELTDLVSEMYAHKSGFDMNFDVSSPDKLYCSEFVYRVMGKVKKDSTFIRSVTRKGFDYIPIDALYINGRARDIWQMRFK